MTEPYKSLETRIRETMRQHIIDKVKLTTKVIEQPKPQPEPLKEEVIEEVKVEAAVEPIEEGERKHATHPLPDTAGDNHAIYDAHNRDGDHMSVRVKKTHEGYYADTGDFDMQTKTADEMRTKLKKLNAKHAGWGHRWEALEELAPAVDPMKDKMAAQRLQVQKQRDQFKMQLQKQKAAKQMQADKDKGEKELEKIKEGDVFDHHSTNIAKKTLKMHDAAVNIMGGMNKEQARSHLKKMGWSDKRIHDHEHGKTVKEEEQLDERQVRRVRTFGRAQKLQQLHRKQYSRLSAHGDRAGAETHRKRAAEYARIAYQAQDNPGKLPSI